MRSGLRFRPIGWIAGVGTLAAMAATMVVAAPGGARPGPEKQFETSFEASCILAPGVLNAKGMIKVHESSEGPSTLERHDEFSLPHNTITVTTPKEWGEDFFAVGSRSIKGLLTNATIVMASATPVNKNIAKPLEFSSGLPIKATVEDQAVEFTVPSEGRTFEAGPWVVTGTQGGDVAGTLGTAPGYREVSTNKFEATGEGILSEITGFNESGEANVGPVQVACTVPGNEEVYDAPILGEGTTSTESVNATEETGPCGSRTAVLTCRPESTSTSHPLPTASTTSTTTPCGICVQINDKLTGSVTVHKLGQAINLPVGCTFRSTSVSVPGSFEANTRCPAFTASLKILGLLRTSLGLNIVESGPVTGAITPLENGKLQIKGTAKDNIEITSVGLLGLTIPTACKTAEPVVFGLDSANTPAELITTGATSSGETTLPAVQCGGPLGGVVGTLFTALMSGPHNPYTLTIAPE